MPAQYLTSDYLTKFELAKIMGMRQLQLIKLQNSVSTACDPLQRTIWELKHGENPVVVRRYLPNGEYEDRKVSELKLTQEMLQFQLCEHVP